MRLSKIFVGLTGALGLFPLLKLNHFSILMIVWFVMAIILGVKNKTFKNIKQHNITFLVLSFLSLMYFLYVPFASDYSEVFKSIIKSLPLLVFPIGFLVNKQLITDEVLSIFKKVFITSVFAINVFGWIKVFQFGIVEAFSKNDFYHPIFRNLFHEATSMHLPYLGLLSAFATLWIIYEKIKSKQLKIYNLSLILFFLLSIYIYSARMALVGFIVCLVYLCLQSLTNKKLKFSLIIFIPIITVTIVYFSPLKERYTNLFSKELVLPHKNQQPHEVNYRYAILYCTTNIIKDHFFIGVGPDNAQKSLNKCYDTFTYKSYEDFTKVTYNTHNQYLDQMLKFGVIGLLLFLFSLFYFFKKIDVLYQVFMIMIALSFLTENILDRQIGVVFFSLLNTMFVVRKLNSLEKSISS